jgi:hypothetical protein
LTTFGPRDRGLSAERTALAWTRMLLAVLANGALLMVRSSFHAYNGSGRLFAVGLAGILALITCVIGRRRQRTLAHRPLPQRITPRREVYLVGISVLALNLVAAVALPI